MFKVKFEYPYRGKGKVRFEVENIPPCSALLGESGTGKTFLFNALRFTLDKYMLQVESDPDLYFGRIWTLNEYNSLDDFRRFSSEENSLLFIDNYDHLIAIYGDSLLNILYGSKCHLLISTRSCIGLNCGSDQKLYATFNKGVLRFKARSDI